MPQNGTAFCIIARVKRVCGEKDSECLGSFLATIGVGKEQNFGQISFAWRTEPLPTSLNRVIGMEMHYSYFGFSLVRQPNCAKYGSDIIKQRAFITAIFGEFIHADSSQIACNFNGQKSNAESNY